MKKVLVIIPAYNEEANISRVADNLIKNYQAYDYVVINDNSRDSTERICREKRYNCLNLPVNLGLAGAFQSGMMYAARYNYSAALQLDGDGQHDPRYIESMLREMKKSAADIVIASRFKEKRKTFSPRMAGSLVLEYAIKVTTGKRLKDPTSGMRLFNKKMISLFANNINFGPEPDTLAYLMRCGVKVSEIPAEMRERTAGESYLDFWRSIVYMVNMLFSIFAGQFIRRKEV